MISFPGGPEARERLSVLAGAVGDLGHRVTVLTRRRAGRSVPSGGSRYQVQELAMGPPTELAESDAIEHIGELVQRLRPVLARGGFDVLHANGWLAGLAAQLAAGEGTPVVQAYDQTDPVGGSDPVTGAPPAGSLLRAQRAVLRNACQIIVAHDGHREVLLRDGVARHRINIVPPGLLTEGAEVSAGGTVRHGARRRVLVCGGGPGTARALSALAGRALRSADAQILAWDSAAEPLAPIAVSAGVTTPVQGLAGIQTCPTPRWHGDRAEVLRSVDLVVSGERTGLTYLEAMALGIPVVAVSAESAEAVVDGVTGVHVLDPTREWLGRVVHRLLANATQRRTMGLAALDRIAGRYSWAQIAAETVAVYRQCASPLDPPPIVIINDGARSVGERESPAPA